MAESVALLVFISVYASVIGHWSAFQSAKAEAMRINCENALNQQPCANCDAVASEGDYLCQECRA